MIINIEVEAISFKNACNYISLNLAQVFSKQYELIGIKNVGI